MADEEIQANTEVVETPAEVQYVSMDEYKNLQRKLSQKDKTEREIRKQLAEFTTRAASEGRRFDDTLQAVVDALSGNDLLDVTKAKAALQQAQANRQSNEYAARLMGRLAEVVGDEDFNTDAKYTSAREMWNNGRYEEAIAESQRVNAPAESSEQFDKEEFARQIRSDIMKELGRVDTGSTTSTSSANSSVNELSQIDTRRMTPAQLKEHQAKLWDAMEKEQGVKYKR